MAIAAIDMNRPICSLAWIGLPLLAVGAIGWRTHRIVAARRQVILNERLIEATRNYAVARLVVNAGERE